MSARTLSVFEHQSVRVGEVLTSAEFDALARFNDTSEMRYFEIGHRRITFRHYVGFIQVGELGIEVLPKADRVATERGDEARWHSGLLEMLGVATGVRLDSPTIASQRTTRANLLEIVVRKFVDEVDSLLRRGLAKGYRQQEANGPNFRGRLLIAENLRENLTRADRFYVRHQTYDADVLLNRILRIALDQTGRLSLPPELAVRTETCRSVFPDVSPIRALPSVFERVVLGRSTERYRSALTLARMILECISPELRAGPHAVFALLFDMNDLWERYVAALFRRANVPGLVVSTQESRSFWKVSGERARAVRPDIVVRVANTSETILVADTKWKVPRDGRPADDDLKQMFVYNQLLRSPRSLLLYPSAGTTNSDATGEFVAHRHTCGKAYLGLFDGGGWSSARMRADVRRILEDFAMCAESEHQAVSSAPLRGANGTG